MRETPATKKAYEAGRTARYNGAARSAPGRKPATIEAWLDGWDDENEDLNERDEIRAEFESSHAT